MLSYFVNDILRNNFETLVRFNSILKHRRTKRSETWVPHGRFSDIYYFDENLNLRTTNLYEDKCREISINHDSWKYLLSWKYSNFFGLLNHCLFIIKRVYSISRLDCLRHIVRVVLESSDFLSWFLALLDDFLNNFRFISFFLFYEVLKIVAFGWRIYQMILVIISEIEWKWWVFHFE